MKNKYRLYGFMSPTNSSPAFTTPVFEKNNAFYVQVIDELDVIDSFEKIDESFMDYYQGGKDEFLSEGDNAVFSVKDKYSCVNFNNKINTKRYLENNIESYIDSPYFYKTVSEFCEHSLPEFWGCKTNRDYLVRQVISNLIPEFSRENNVRIESIDHVFPKCKKAYHIKINSRKSISTLKLKSDFDNIGILFKSFLEHAESRHEKIAQEKIFISSKSLSHHIFPNWLEDDNLDYLAIRENLIYILGYKLNSNIISYKQKTEITNNVFKSGRLSYFYEKDSYMNRIKADESISAEGLSFALYVTSLLSKFARDEYEKEHEPQCDCQHITKQLK